MTIADMVYQQVQTMPTKFTVLDTVGIYLISI
jgi:hypothetical protein